ncbi:hypothetical protein MtrunA17_Chr6g0465081 [Medicago truncatula]|uniref:Uncharacterized protein n=1 Tax=Medicago truncatula TaxID=3880 RepID=A0A396HCU2_MEDTR|nr:hypothetical protein MtrunA17_Chr6g0465081 [Medicago truncatula]
MLGVLANSLQHLEYNRLFLSNVSRVSLPHFLYEAFSHTPWYAKELRDKDALEEPLKNTSTSWDKSKERRKKSKKATKRTLSELICKKSLDHAN